MIVATAAIQRRKTDAYRRYSEIWRVQLTLFSAMLLYIDVRFEDVVPLLRDALKCGDQHTFAYLLYIAARDHTL